uniref:Outer membrane protein beta-barrel domain-containing protein n=1 Tax=Leptocylindrus danicus TaxID=163516 RepID=A0A7S2K333_9STRA|mmetsp:Transcript_15970/g.23528  ORF Transcript_15970/g.23528 Transcript_15970/m.23528 type:complete len:180 (+) Transcript_15970:95-634(+)
MKRFFLPLFLLFTIYTSFGQEKKIKPFFEVTFMPTIAINEDYTVDTDDDETFLRLSATFFRLGVGYQFGNRVLLSVNAGYDHHFPYAINAIPTYVKLRYNLWTDFEQSWFFQFSRGKMWRPADRFSDGDYYNVGMGYELESGSRWKPIIKFTYHRKNINGFEDDGVLESISIGIGFRFF